MQLLPFEVAKITSRLRPENFSSLLQLYGSDLPSVKSFDIELDMWQNKWTGDPEQAQELNTPEKVLAHTDSDYFPNIHTLIVIMATLPVTSCECELFARDGPTMELAAVCTLPPRTLLIVNPFN